MPNDHLKKTHSNIIGGETEVGWQVDFSGGRGAFTHIAAIDIGEPVNWGRGAFKHRGATEVGTPVD